MDRLMRWTLQLEIVRPVPVLDGRQRLDRFAELRLGHIRLHKGL